MNKLGRLQHIPVGGPRFEFLRRQAEQVVDLPGAVVEVGVWRGNSARLLVATLIYKSVHLFDTFEGMPEVTKGDRHKKGDFGNTSLERVKGYLQDFDNAIFYPGLFPETAESLTEDEFCLVHIDVDIYESTKAAIEYFWPLLVPGGIMVFDDYNSPTCPGTNKAVDEFFEPLGLAVTPSGKNKRYGTRMVK